LPVCLIRLLWDWRGGHRGCKRSIWILVLSSVWPRSIRVYHLLRCFCRIFAHFRWLCGRSHDSVGQVMEVKITSPIKYFDLIIYLTPPTQTKYINHDVAKTHANT
jgi:hypothetical protein